MLKNIYANEKTLEVHERSYFLSHRPLEQEPQVWLVRVFPFYQELISFSCFLMKERQYSSCTADGYLRDLNNFVLINEYQNLYFQEINIDKIIERFRTGEIIKHNAKILFFTGISNKSRRYPSR